MLKGRTALITGATGGIGRSIASALAHAGADLMLNGLGDADENSAWCAALMRQHGVRAELDRADLRSAAQIENMIAEAQRHFGSIDILINAAGIQHVAPVEDFPPEKWDEILALNLTASFHTTRLVLPTMKRWGWGRIVNIGSAHSLVASPFKSAYVAAKHGLAGFSRTVALEVAQQGITVNTVCPGYVLTPLVEAQIPATMQARGLSEEEVIRDVLLAAQPTRRFVTTSEVADTVCFLCSEAARSITGACLSVDGGWTAQ